MDARQRLVACCALATFAALIATPSAAAGPGPIKGKLSKRGYTVLALDLRGRGRGAAATPKFRVKPTARVVTLHLRDNNGRYAGPIVAGRSGKRVVVGVRAGADLGRVTVKRGYAFFVPDVDDEVLLTLRARAKRGRPIGARVLGRVRTRASGKDGLGRDPDRDGLPGAFDVDDDGDLVLDNVDRTPLRARTSADGIPNVIAPGGDVAHYNARWVINGGLEVSYLAEARGYAQGVAGYAVNQNAAGPFAADADFARLIDLFMIERGGLFMPLPDSAAELDCTGISYCEPGGTGFFHTRNQKFPENFDTDGDGFGSMQAVPAFREGQDGLGLIQAIEPKSVFGLAPLAVAEAIQPGDMYIQKLANGSPDRYVTLRSVYGTVPALVSWADGTRTETIEYPVPRGAEGAENNGFTVKPNDAGQHILRLTVWRPQREATSASEPPYVDLGGLTYTVVGKTAEQNRRLFKCEGSSYSTSDGNLSVTADGLLDKAADQPVNRANTLTFSVNLTQCLQSSGITEANPPTITVFVSASSGLGDMAEGVGFAFKLVGKNAAGSDEFTGTWRFVNGTPGTDIEWTVKSNSGTATGIGAIAYGGRTVVSGTPPAGWTCQIQSSGSPNNTYGCGENTLSPGQTATGTMTLDGPYSPDQPIGMLICKQEACSGSGMVYSP